jgi:hypothetical protein
LHHRQDSLGSKKLVPQIDRHCEVPELLSDVLDGMPRVVSGIVDKNINRASLLDDICDRLTQHVNISEIASMVCGDMAGRA